MKRSWYEIRNAQAAEAEISLYDEIGLWGITAKDFVAELKAITAPIINLYINSPGGEVFDGIAIYNGLKDHPATVNVQVDALAASAASFIAMAGDRIVMQKTATMMIHEASGMAWGDAATMAKMAEELGLMSDTIAEIYADRAGGKADEWRAVMQAETWYKAQEAVDAGLADEVGTLGSAKAFAHPRFFNLAKFRNVPLDLQRPENAGRVMSGANLDKLHAALDGLDAVHDGTCDMGTDCPMTMTTKAAPVADDNEPTFDLGEAIREAVAALTV